MDALEQRVSELEKMVADRDERIAALEQVVAQLDEDKSAALEAQWPAEKIRSTFVDFFTERAHAHVPSSPVVPFNDPTLLFINAGMNQFKSVFTGTVDPTSALAGLSRAANAQKCIRAGGKHNDLDDVGKDVYHHTFFEMLGNWSFGDYFKEEAIGWAWELLTTVFGLDPERLYATYFGGDEAQGVPCDDEAREIWLRYLPAARVLPFGCKDNFWEMGDTGPCGPCTEIHYDRIGNRDAAELVNADLPDVLEIWNVVFIQYNREPDSTLRTLPHKHIDTGMGFERVASILQGKTSNYDTDVFRPLFDAIHAVSDKRPYSGLVGDDDTENIDMAYRVVADHVRTLTFAITDGAVPNNEGRGYVLRRVLRRGVRYGMEILGAPRGFFAQLVPVVVEQMKDAYPELPGRMDFVMEIVAGEEESFARTLAAGIAKFKKFAAETKAAGGAALSGEHAFFLYDSMGFPYDLTELMAEEAGLTVDKAAYEACMEAQREQGDDSEAPLLLQAEQTAFLAGDGVEPTDTAPKYEWNPEAAPATVRAIFTADGFVDEAAPGTRVGVILDRTYFYPEAGGQVNDTGSITVGDATVTVTDVQSYGGFALHVGTVEGGNVAKGAAAACAVDYERRARIAPNHTMTHVLNFALRKTLPESQTPDQKGSLVDDEKLRFDFSCTRPLTPEELAQIEAIVQDQIARSLEVHHKVASLEAARRIHSLRAVFGETYPDPVRVISVGADVDALLADPENAEWGELSIEFCGGTHLSNTSEAGGFALVSESGIAKGIRRIIGLTGGKAAEAAALAEALQAEVDAAAALGDAELAVALNPLRERIEQSAVSVTAKGAMVGQLTGPLFQRIKAYRKANAAAIKAQAVAEAERIAAEEAPGNAAIVVVVPGGDGKSTKDVLNVFDRQCPDTSVLFAAVDDVSGKMTVAARSNGSVSAKDWVGAALAAVGGRGGGKPARAQGQADSTDIEAVLGAARGFL